MPGQLKPTATCPHCGTDLVAIFDTHNSEGVTREYLHAKLPLRKRRRRNCFFHFDSFEAATKERRALEI